MLFAIEEEEDDDNVPVPPAAKEAAADVFIRFPTAEGVEPPRRKSRCNMALLLLSPERCRPCCLRVEECRLAMFTIVS